MRTKAKRYMGTGRAEGDKRALSAMNQAISSPLLEDISIDGATGLLINITGGRDMTLQEVNEALTLVHDAADPEAEIIFGSLIDDQSRDEIKITIIATGFVRREPKQRPLGTPVQVPLLRPQAHSHAHAPSREESALATKGALRITLVGSQVGQQPQNRHGEGWGATDRRGSVRHPHLPASAGADGDAVAAA